MSRRKNIKSAEQYQDRGWFSADIGDLKPWLRDIADRREQSMGAYVRCLLRVVREKHASDPHKFEAWLGDVVAANEAACQASCQPKSEPAEAVVA